MKFIKMHGAGNDYVFVDGFQHSLPTRLPDIVSQVSDRHFGVGADGVVAMIPPPAGSDPINAHGSFDVDVVMKMWNADGSRGAMCGNAARCVAFWMKRKRRVFDQCRISMGQIRIAADVSSVTPDSVRAESIALRLPIPRFGRNVLLEGIDAAVNFSDHLPASSPVHPSLLCDTVDCGNEHAVVFASALSDELVRTLGPLIESHQEFPNRINVEFVLVRNRQTLEVRVWERGSGETLACGSGACAAAVAAVRRGFCDANSEIRVHLPGGILRVEAIPHSDGSQTDQVGLILRGPVCFEFEGVWMGKSSS